MRRNWNLPQSPWTFGVRESILSLSLRTGESLTPYDC
jgi:hypothetical protein